MTFVCVISVLGGWDMFHSGHMKVLKEAKSMGDYLIAGYVEKNTNTHNMSLYVERLFEMILMTHSG